MPAARPSVFRLVSAVILGAMLAVFLLALPRRNSESALMSRFWAILNGRGIQFDVTQPTVVNRIQNLQRLETVQYTMDKVVTGQRSSAILPDFLAGDRLLLLVHGQVVAGIDFASLRSGDVAVHGREIRLHVPTAQLFSTRLDSTKTRVYSRQTGLLVPVDPNLETEVRQQAEHDLEQSALADGILNTAQQNARSTLTSLLNALGFQKIDFD
ncbi:MAG TPA: DUF4230 domain-containing protein [Terriglobales bacterium]|nr:DUF4230 domain-containing protein [Terriglobales bacterium]